MMTKDVQNAFGFVFKERSYFPIGNLNSYFKTSLNFLLIIPLIFLTPYILHITVSLKKKKNLKFSYIN